jgi:hypothetical protein
MADCDWIILCDYAFPAMHGKLCMVGIFDMIFATAVPAAHARAFIGFSLVGEPGEKGEAKLEIIGPTGQVVSSAKAAFTLPELGSAFGALEVQNLVLPEFGRYAIQIDLGESLPKQAWFTLQKTPTAT